MSEILERNKEYASVMKDSLKLRGEPVAIRLIRENEEFPAGYSAPDKQLSHCQAIFVAKRVSMPKTKGEVVCPLKDADFVPDVVAIVDIPERVYWIVPLSTSNGGGRMAFSTSPFQCACEDVTSVPMVTGAPNVSLGCFGCRKKTDMAADELACGIPYDLIPGYIEHLKKYSSGVMTKAKRD